MRVECDDIYKLIGFFCPCHTLIAFVDQLEFDKDAWITPYPDKGGRKWHY